MSLLLVIMLFFCRLLYVPVDFDHYVVNSTGFNVSYCNVVMNISLYKKNVRNDVYLSATIVCCLKLYPSSLKLFSYGYLKRFRKLP